MNIKRYNPICAPLGDGSCMPEMEECANGNFYSRADLIAAGVLVPVPDGEAVGVDNLPVVLRIALTDRTGVYRRVGSGASTKPEPHSFVILEDCNSGDEINVPYGTHGYPVRLVPIAEATHATRN